MAGCCCVSPAHSPPHATPAHAESRFLTNDCQVDAVCASICRRLQGNVRTESEWTGLAPGEPVLPRTMQQPRSRPCMDPGSSTAKPPHPHQFLLATMHAAPRSRAGRQSGRASLGSELGVARRLQLSQSEEPAPTQSAGAAPGQDPRVVSPASSPETKPVVAGLLRRAQQAAQPAVPSSQAVPAGPAPLPSQRQASASGAAAAPGQTERQPRGGRGPQGAAAAQTSKAPVVSAVSSGSIRIVLVGPHGAWKCIVQHAGLCHGRGPICR